MYKPVGSTVLAALIAAAPAVWDSSARAEAPLSGDGPMAGIQGEAVSAYAKAWAAINAASSGPFRGQVEQLAEAPDAAAHYPATRANLLAEANAGVRHAEPAVSGEAPTLIPAAGAR